MQCSRARKLWDAASGNELATFPHGHMVRSVALADDGALLVTGCNDKFLRVFDSARPATPLLQLALHAAVPRQTVLLPGGHTVVSGGEDRTLQFWDVRSGAVAAAHALAGEPTSIELAPDGSLTVTHGRAIERWDNMQCVGPPGYKKGSL
jgi:serine-threonine kinase receptor-associated protein